jgi:hypothetical protein
MTVPGLDGNFKDRKKNADGGYESFCALPILLVPLHAVFKFRDATAVAVAHEAIDLRFEDGEIAQDLGFEFIHHAHSGLPKRSRIKKPMETLELRA